MQNKSYKSRLRSYESVRTLDDHALFHTMPEHAAEFDFLTKSGAECDLHTLPKSDCEAPEAALEHIVEVAVKNGARVAYADITPSDISPLGPRVVRVFITGMQPIDFGFAQGRLGGRRLYTAPVDWGYRTQPLIEPELNQCPHPLA
jgi:ribosomal protein S12 methylthiotransferase accessory factor